MKNRIFISLIILLNLSSCSYFKEKMTCDNKEANELLKQNIKKDIVEAFALKLSADAYSEYKYGFFSSMSDAYKNYLLIQLKKIRNKEGQFYERAVEEYSSNNVILSNIITESYDEKIDKCECSAEIELTNSESKNKVTFDNVKNSEGEVTGHYKYKTKVMLDKETNATDFIKTNNSLLDNIEITENETSNPPQINSSNSNIGETTIRQFIAFEDDKNFTGISNLFAPNIKRYWRINNPTISQIEKVYNDSWDLKNYSKNEILSITQNESGAFKVNLNYTFTKNNVTKTINSNVWFVIDANGKVLETYGGN